MWAFLCATAPFVCSQTTTPSNPITEDSIGMESRNLSALTPYTSKAHHGRNSAFIALRFNLKLDFGRKTREVLSIDNEIDSDSGILTGTK